MKHLLVAALALQCFALSGCTVHNHYYGSSQGTATLVPECELAPGHALLALQLDGVHSAIDAVADNLANLNALGYKSNRITFIQGQTQPQITTDWRVGSAIPTGRELDVFIEGEGFFRVDLIEDLGGGEAYTRMGNFFISRDGDMILGNADGPRLSGGITIFPDALGISISSSGEIHCILSDGSVTNVGQITLHRFASPDGLKPLGNGLYLETETSGPPHSDCPRSSSMSTILQGHLEASNVNLIMELVELKRLTRWADTISAQLGLPALERQPMFTFSSDILPSQEIDTMLGHDLQPVQLRDYFERHPPTVGPGDHS